MESDNLKADEQTNSVQFSSSESKDNIVLDEISAVNNSQELRLYDDDETVSNVYLGPVGEKSEPITEQESVVSSPSRTPPQKIPPVTKTVTPTMVPSVLNLRNKTTPTSSSIPDEDDSNSNSGSGSKGKVLNKDQMKKRLQSYSLLKQGICPAKKVSPSVKQTKIQVQINETYDEDGKRIEEQMFIVKKPSKQGSTPHEKAKAVIDEIEKIKRDEATLLENTQFLKNRLLVNHHKERPPPPPVHNKIKLVKSVNKSVKSNKELKRSDLNKSKVNKKTGEKRKAEDGLEDWAQIKRKHFDFKKISTIKEKFLIGSSKRNETPKKFEETEKKDENPLPIVTLSRLGTKKYYPAELIEFTTKQPSIMYCENPLRARAYFRNRKQILNSVSTERSDIMNQIIHSKMKSRAGSKSKVQDCNVPVRDWYPLTNFLNEHSVNETVPEINTEPVTPEVTTDPVISYGLSVLTENYNDDLDESIENIEDKSKTKNYDKVEDTNVEKKEKVKEEQKSKEKKKSKSNIKSSERKQKYEYESENEDKTPDTEEYRSNWESDEDVFTELMHMNRNSFSPARKWESDEEEPERRGKEKRKNKTYERENKKKSNPDEKRKSHRTNFTMNEEKSDSAPRAVKQVMNEYSMSNKWSSEEDLHNKHKKCEKRDLKLNCQRDKKHEPEPEFELKRKEKEMKRTKDRFEEKQEETKKKLEEELKTLESAKQVLKEKYEAELTKDVEKLWENELSVMFNHSKKKNKSKKKRNEPRVKMNYSDLEEDFDPEKEKALELFKKSEELKCKPKIKIDYSDFDMSLIESKVKIVRKFEEGEEEEDTKNSTRIQTEQVTEVISTPEPESKPEKLASEYEEFMKAVCCEESKEITVPEQLELELELESGEVKQINNDIPPDDKTEEPLSTSCSSSSSSSSSESSSESSDDTESSENSSNPESRKIKTESEPLSDTELNGKKRKRTDEKLNSDNENSIKTEIVKKSKKEKHLDHDITKFNNIIDWETSYGKNVDPYYDVFKDPEHLKTPEHKAPPALNDTRTPSPTLSKENTNTNSSLVSSSETGSGSGSKRPPTWNLSITPTKSKRQLLQNVASADSDEDFTDKFRKSDHKKQSETTNETKEDKSKKEHKIVPESERRSSSISKTTERQSQSSSHERRIVRSKSRERERDEWRRGGGDERNRRRRLSDRKPLYSRSRSRFSPERDLSRNRNQNQNRIRDRSYDRMRDRIPRRRFSRSPSPSPHRDRDRDRNRDRDRDRDRDRPIRPDETSSPINSPLDGFKRSLADSTISDSELIGQRTTPDECNEPSSAGTYRYHNRLNSSPSSSPKRISLDDRINLVLGIEKESPKQIGTVCTSGPFGNRSGSGTGYHNHNHNHHDPYAYGGRSEYEMYNGPGRDGSYPPPGPYSNQYQSYYSNTGGQMLPPPPPPPAPPADGNIKVMQVGNVIQVVPTEQPVVPSASSAAPLPQMNEMPPKVVQVGNMLQIVPMSDTNSTTAPATKIAHKSVDQFVLERRAEKEKRRLEREQRRKEKEKKRKERELRKQMKIKTKTENMIRRALMLETGESELDMSNLDEEITNEGNEGVITPLPWPPGPMMSGTQPLQKYPSKGILISRALKKEKDEMQFDENMEVRKVVKFADGVYPGEGTSPSGGEDLPSPPPPPSRKLRKEKRYKKLMIKNKKKIKVKIIRTQQQQAAAPEDEEDDSEDNLPPPPPPPGSPPLHLWPPRIKQPPINNIHPQLSAAVFPPNPPYPSGAGGPPAPPHPSHAPVMYPGPYPNGPPIVMGHVPPPPTGPRHHPPVIPVQQPHPGVVPPPPTHLALPPHHGPPLPLHGPPPFHH